MKQKVCSIERVKKGLEEIKKLSNGNERRIETGRCCLVTGDATYSIVGPQESTFSMSLEIL
jgi:hypothetical protein